VDVTIDDWLRSASADVERRGLREVRPLLESLAGALGRLRVADWEMAADAELPAGEPASAGAGSSGRNLQQQAPAKPAEPAPSGHPLAARPIRQLAAMMRDGSLSPAQLLDECLGVVRARDREINAFVTVTAESARVEADAAARAVADGAASPLVGIPFSLKDLIDVAGVPTTAASRMRAGVVARRDATVVARLRQENAVLVGKCNLHEFAFGTTNEDSAFGPVHHPADLSRSPGGSSGGSAAAVLAGMCVASLGTDTGGSIRIPAAACGLVGLKPTFGAIPLDGVVPLGTSLDHIGPIARTVDDASIVYDAIRGYAHSTDVPIGSDTPPSALRLAVPRDYFLDQLDDAVRAAFEGAVAALRRAGADVADVAIPHAALTAPVYLATVLPEAARYHAATLERRAADYTPQVRLRLEMSRYVLGEDYLRAQHGRDVLRREVDAALSGRHALLLPTLPVVATKLGEPTVRMGVVTDSVRNATLRLTQLFDLTGHPAISVPCGRSPEGLPVGAQLVGRLRQTRDLLRVAAACEGVFWGLTPEMLGNRL
jgi:aspartyl-tRNA(Asn)/glutamyl-tRNA(Gln) amidotransferase subunit A